MIGFIFLNCFAFYSTDGGIVWCFELSEKFIQMRDEWFLVKLQIKFIFNIKETLPKTLNQFLFWVFSQFFCTSQEEFTKICKNL